MNGVIINTSNKISVKVFISPNLKNTNTINSLYIRVVYKKKNTSIPYYKLVFDNTFDKNTIIDDNTDLFLYENIAYKNIMYIMGFLSFNQKDDISNLSNAIDKFNDSVNVAVKNIMYSLIEKEFFTLTNEIQSGIKIGYLYVYREFYREFHKSNITVFDCVFHKDLSILQLKTKKIYQSLIDIKVIESPIDNNYDVLGFLNIDEYIIS